jgi:hypothetical protein
MRNLNKSRGRATKVIFSIYSKVSQYGLEFWWVLVNIEVDWGCEERGLKRIFLTFPVYSVLIEFLQKLVIEISF